MRRDETTTTFSYVAGLLAEVLSAEGMDDLAYGLGMAAESSRESCGTRRNWRAEALDQLAGAVDKKAQWMEAEEERKAKERRMAAGGPTADCGGCGVSLHEGEAHDCPE
jgi:hypothetical protein